MLVLAGGLLVGCAAASAQQAADEPGLTATLPTNNEALLVAGQVSDAIENGDYRLAIALLQRLLEHAPELVVVPPGRTCYPVWRLRARLMDQLPPEALAMYRQLYDAEIAGRLDEAVRRGDRDALRELFRIYRGSTLWPQIGGELVATLLDDGRFAETDFVIRTLSEAGVELGPERRAQWAVALARLDRPAAAQALLAEAPEAPGTHAADELWPAVRAYVDSLSAAPPNAADFAPAWAAGAVWGSVLTPAGPGELFEDDEAVADAVETAFGTRVVPRHQPVLDGQTLVVRLRGTVWAYDALTLTPRWRVREFVPTTWGASDVAWPPSVVANPLDAEEASRPVSADALVLLTNSLRHEISTGFGQVFTVESLPLAGGETGEWSAQRAGLLDSLPLANELVARELLTGDLCWRTGGDPDAPLAGVAFQCAPLALDDRLYVPFQRGSDLVLGVLEPVAGQVLAEIPVVGPPTHFGVRGGRCLLTADETSIYVCTGNGVVAAFDRRDLGWQWAATYPSTLASWRPADWWSPRQTPGDHAAQPPVLVDDLLVLAPADCPYIFALDRLDGRQRWRRERGRHDLLLGALHAGTDTAGLIVASDTLTCLDAADGAAVRWRSVPLALTGRPAVRDVRGETPCLFAPTAHGVVVLDGRNGKVLGGSPEVETQYAVGQTEPSDVVRPAPTANLLCSSAAVFAVSPSGIAKYADIDRTRAAAEALLATAPVGSDADRARLTLAWTERLAGGYEQALAALEALNPAEQSLAVARDHLLTDVLVAIAAHSAGGDERLRWLRRAAQPEAGDAANSVRLALMIGRALEEKGAWIEAAGHYAELLRLADAEPLAVAGEPRREAAGWLQAVARLRELRSRLTAEQTAALIDGWAERESIEFLQRLRLVFGTPDPAADEPGHGRLLEPSPAAATLDRAIALRGSSAVAAEILISYLADADNPELSDEERRELHLCRWETHVALGLAEQARADQRTWYEDWGSLMPRPANEGDEATDELAQRVRRIERAQTQLDEEVAAPLDAGSSEDVASIGRYRWRLPGCELLIDQRHPARLRCGWLPVRNLEQPVIAVHSAARGRQWHHTVDALQSGPGARAALTDAAEAVLFGDDHSQSGEAAMHRHVWPAAIYGHLAAIPARLGRALICIGLGPERSGGQRLWECPLPEWLDVPRDLARTAVAGPLGVHLVRRGDRVALVGWLDGHIWWQRDLPGMNIDAIYLAGSRLVVAGRNDTVISVDAMQGDDLRLLPAGWGTPRAVAVAGDVVIVWGDERMAGFDPATFECLWTRPSWNVGSWSAVEGAPWLACRERGSERWLLLNVRSGQPVFEAGLGNLGRDAILALDRGQLFAAGVADQSLDAPPEAEPAEPVGYVRLAAFDPADGRCRWRSELPTAAPVNVTQLLAHPDVIPLLEAGGVYEYWSGVNYRSLALRLLDKRSGTMGPAVAVSEHFTDGDGTCGAYLLAIPGRIIVQANGTLAAYGVPAARTEP
ncbi:MAG: PQQ-binding-like beta-propeller repeat protein [Phycisphaerae bacterium]|jgi:hypothetical protein